MKRLILFLLLLPTAAFAQYVRYDASLQTAQGQAVAGAQVYVLAQPTTGALTPLATVYSNATGLGGAVTQPLLTDGFGHVPIYALTGTYTVVYISPYTGTQTYPDQAFGGGGNGVSGVSSVGAYAPPGSPITATITGLPTAPTVSVSLATSSTGGVAVTTVPGGVANNTNAIVGDGAGGVVSCSGPSCPSGTGGSAPKTPVNSIQVYGTTTTLLSDPNILAIPAYHDFEILSAGFEDQARLQYDPMSTQYAGGYAGAVAGTSGSTPTQVLQAVSDYAECQYQMGVVATNRFSVIVPSNFGSVPITGLKLWSQEDFGGRSLLDAPFFQHADSSQPMINEHVPGDTLTCSNGTTYTPVPAGGQVYGIHRHDFYISGMGPVNTDTDIGIHNGSQQSTTERIGGYGNGFGGPAYFDNGAQSTTSYLGYNGQLKGCQSYVTGVRPISDIGNCFAIMSVAFDSNNSFWYATDGSQLFTGTHAAAPCDPNCGAMASFGDNNTDHDFFAQISDTGIVVTGLGTKGSHFRSDASSRSGMILAGTPFGNLTGNGALKETFTDIGINSACTDQALIGSAVVNTSGTTATFVSGVPFTSYAGSQSPLAAGNVVSINGANYTVTGTPTASSLTLSSTAGTQSNVSYYVQGTTGCGDLVDDGQSNDVSSIAFADSAPTFGASNFQARIMDFGVGGSGSPNTYRLPADYFPSIYNNSQNYEAFGGTFGNDHASARVSYPPGSTAYTAPGNASNGNLNASGLTELVLCDSTQLKALTNATPQQRVLIFGGSTTTCGSNVTATIATGGNFFLTSATMTPGALTPIELVNQGSVNGNVWVVSNGGGTSSAGGGLTGQTAGQLPVANSATTSAASSSFFDTGTVAGTTEPFSAPSISGSGGPNGQLLLGYTGTADSAIGNLQGGWNQALAPSTPFVHSMATVPPAYNASFPSVGSFPLFTPVPVSYTPSSITGSGTTAAVVVTLPTAPYAGQLVTITGASTAFGGGGSVTILSSPTPTTGGFSYTCPATCSGTASGTLSVIVYQSAQETWQAQNQINVYNGGLTNTVYVNSPSSPSNIVGQTLAYYSTGATNGLPNVQPYTTTAAPWQPFDGVYAPGNVTAFNTAQVFRQGDATLFMSTTTTQNDLIVPSTSTAGFGQDSGYTAAQIGSIPCTTPVIGEVETSAGGAGSVARVRLYPPGSYGTGAGSGCGSGGAGTVTAPGSNTAQVIPENNTSATGTMSLINSPITDIPGSNQIQVIDTLVVSPSSTACSGGPCPSQNVFTPVATCSVVASAFNFCVDTVTTAQVMRPPNAPGSGTVNALNTSGNVQLSYNPYAFQTISPTTLASASTITPTYGMTLVSGTTAISTITPLAGMTSTIGGCIVLVANAALPFTTGGNISSPAFTATAGQSYFACWIGTSWTVK